VTIGSGITSIGEIGFAACPNLISITCYAITQPTITDVTFKGIGSNGTLYVPQGSDYSTWMNAREYYLGYYHWTKVEL
jgi:hypothetical protein